MSSYIIVIFVLEERRDEKFSDVEKENDIKRGKESGEFVDKLRFSLCFIRFFVCGKVLICVGG